MIATISPRRQFEIISSWVLTLPLWQEVELCFLDFSASSNLFTHTSVSGGIFSACSSDSFTRLYFRSSSNFYVRSNILIINPLFSLCLQWFCFPTDALGIFWSFHSALFIASVLSFLMAAKWPPQPSIMPSYDIAQIQSRSVSTKKNFSLHFSCISRRKCFYQKPLEELFLSLINQNGVTYLALNTNEGAGLPWLV